MATQPKTPPDKPPPEVLSDSWREHCIPKPNPYFDQEVQRAIETWSIASGAKPEHP